MKSETQPDLFPIEYQRARFETFFSSIDRRYLARQDETYSHPMMRELFDGWISGIGIEGSCSEIMKTIYASQ